MLPSMNDNLQAQTSWRIDWEFGSAEVRALGAMLGPVRFKLDATRDLEVMHVAPWAGQASSSSLPGVLQSLRGEWPCVPFGRTDTPLDLPADWTLREPEDDWSHGYGSNHVWTCEEVGPDHILLTIDYPTSAAVSRLERRIQAVAGTAALDIELTVHPRRTVTLPIGLHPTFRLPAPSGRVLIDVEANEGIYTYPSRSAGESTLLRPDQRGESLDQMPGVDGNVDLSRLPLLTDTEELLQVRGLAGRGDRAPLRLHYLDHDAQVELWWDTSVLPDLMLWVSNRGRAGVPWQSRHVALGAEPVNSVFDLSRVAQPAIAHPLSDRRGIELVAGKPWTTRYRMAARQALTIGA